MKAALTLLMLLAVSLATTRAQDLVLTGAVDNADAPIEPGGQLAVNYTITNNSNTTYRNLTIGYYLSRDAVFDDSDLLLESETQNVGANESEPEGEVVRIPSSTAVGAYFFLTVLDPTNLVPETNKENNVLATPITVGSSTAPPTPSARPDLVTALETATVNGNRVTLALTVANVGDADAGFFRVGLYVSSTERLTSSSRIFAAGFLFGQAAGSQNRLSGTVALPSGLAPGDYFIVAAADDLANVPETLEFNNTDAVRVTIAGGGLTARTGGPVAEGDFEPIAAEAAPPMGQPRAYPNPTAGVFALELTRASDAEAVAEVTDVSGRRVRRRVLPAGSAGAASVPFDLSDLPAGVYTVAVTEAGRTAATRLVIRR